MRNSCLLAAVVGLLQLCGVFAARALVTQSLDGEWQLAQDLSDRGRAQTWFKPDNFPLAGAKPAQVPGSFFETWTVSQWPKPTDHLGWYYLKFKTSVPVSNGDHVYLRFGAVREKSEVWLNGTPLGSHAGGEDPVEYDVTKVLLPGQPNTLIVRAWTDSFGGITQHVTLAVQPAVRIVDIFAQPDSQGGKIDVDVALENNSGSAAKVTLDARCSEWKSSRPVSRQTLQPTAPPGASTSRISLNVTRPHGWTLNDPFLYSVTVNENWESAAGPKQDSYACRIGFRDFRVVGGYFRLNGKRLFLRSTHGNAYDPIAIVGTARDTTYIGQDFPQLKKAGFNMMRFIQSTPLPEQLDQADEMGFLVYSEHESSWHVTDPKDFGTTLNAVVRRDRNHPSLVMWGLLNETDALPVYEKAKNWLASLRAIDPTRYIELSSGRWDRDAKTGSGSNPGSSTWDVYLGGEDPTQPASGDAMPDELGAFRPGMGDLHAYEYFPSSWAFLTRLADLSRDAKAVFLSENGIGSTFNAPDEQGKLEKASTSPDAFPYQYIRPALQHLQDTWTKYKLASTYPEISQMMTDSALCAASQRAQLFSAIRGNPKIAGYSLTSDLDFWGAGEGIMDSFREYKAGHLETLQAGWAPLRWCLLVNPTHIYANQPLRIRIGLANEDQLPEGDYAATFTIKGAKGVVWTEKTSITVLAHGPLAYSVMDKDVMVPGLVDGQYQLGATLDNRPNAAAAETSFFVTTRQNVPQLSGSITVAGLSASVRTFISGQGATLHEYAPNEEIDREVILVGDAFTGGADAWRALYARAARGGHIIFLSNKVFGTAQDSLHWLALPNRGTIATNPEWLYHRDQIARPGPLWEGLQPKLMTPDFYGPILSHMQFIQDITPPADPAAMGLYCTLNMAGKFQYYDGLALGTYPYHNGHLTLCAFDILGTVGHPATDRLLVNLVLAAQGNAAPLVAVPANYAAEMDKLQIK